MTQVYRDPVRQRQAEVLNTFVKAAPSLTKEDWACLPSEYRLLWDAVVDLTTPRRRNDARGRPMALRLTVSRANLINILWDIILLSDR